MKPMLRISSSMMFIAAVTAALSACISPPSGRTCVIGQPVTITSNDTIPPTLAVDFFFPDGKFISVGQDSDKLITSNSNGTVTISAKATDPQGVQDIQIIAGERRCRLSDDVMSCSGPGLLGAPSANNPHPEKRGMVACTERMVSHNVLVFIDSTRDVSQQITIVGKNFSGQETKWQFTLRAPQR